ncbi:MAG: TIGR02996 domain-containing protein [Kofleriaceae bacterium]
MFDAPALVAKLSERERWYVRFEKGTSALAVSVEGCTYTTWTDEREEAITLDTFAAVRDAVTALVASAIERGFLPVRKRVNPLHGAYVENPALEAACREAPDDAATWAVYADWLQEHGDPRGELAMLVRQGREDLAGVKLPAGVTFTKWRHGFPIAARCDLANAGAALLDSPIARFCEELEYRETWSWAPEVGAVVEHPRSEHIRALLFETSRNVDGDLSRVWELPRLEHLRAHANVVVELGQIRATHLKRFDRRFGEVTEAEIEAITRAEWPALEHLQLEIQSGVRDFTRTMPIYNATTMPRVRHLAIGGVSLRRALPAFLATPMVAQLRTLDLSKTNVTQKAIEQHAERLQHLETLLLPNP